MWPGNAHIWSQSAKCFNVVSKLFDRVVLQKRMFFWHKTPLTRLLRSAILFGKKMRRLNQISRTYSFESTKITIWFGACKMRRLNRALILFSKFFKNLHNFNNSTFLEVWYVFGDKFIKYHKRILNAIKLLSAQEYIN